jgi:uncharacterized C2H2 Zn-finger protein
LWENEPEGEKKFECSVCHMTFATKAEYEKHMREKHKDYTENK